MYKGSGFFQLGYNGTMKLSLNGTTVYLQMKTNHGNELLLLTVPKINFRAEAGKLFTAEITVL